MLQALTRSSSARVALCLCMRQSYPDLLAQPSRGKVVQLHNGKLACAIREFARLPVHTETRARSRAVSALQALRVVHEEPGQANEAALERLPKDRRGPRGDKRKLPSDDSGVRGF